MNAWGSEALTANNGLYNMPDPGSTPSVIDPSAMFKQNNMDMSQFQNAQFQQRMQNGVARNNSPGFQNPAYNVNPVIPSKRSRPEDGSDMGGNPSMSRSQTPQHMPFPGYQGGQHGGPTPFQHLQQGGSSNATPSPTISNQQFRPPAPPQRVSTVSPSPFPQSQQSMGMSPQTNPVRMNTPQNPQMGQMGGMNFMPGSSMPGTSMPQGYNQNYGGNPNMMAGQGMTNGMSPLGPPMGVPSVALSQNLQAKQADVNQRMAYQMQLQRQQQALAAQNMGQQQRMQGSMNSMLASTGQQPGIQASTGMRPNQPGMPSNAPQSSQEQFLKNVQALNQGQGLSFDSNPVICGRQVPLAALYKLVMSQKGSRRVTAINGWAVIAAQLGLNQAQFPAVAMEVRQVFERYLGAYESAWLQKMQGNMIRGQQGQMGTQIGGISGAQMSPTRATPSSQAELQAQQQQYQQLLQQRAQQAQQAQQPQSTPVQNNAQLPTANGWSTPQPDQSRLQNAFTQHRKSQSRQIEATPTQPGFPTPSPVPEKMPQNNMQPAPAATANGVAADQPPDVRFVHGDVYMPRVKSQLDSHGGVPVVDVGKVVNDLVALRPVVPRVEEMGLIDIHAMTLSIQSGIHGEVRCALDHLVRISHEPRLQLELERCDDLLDVLIECAEEQVDALHKETAEVSDILDLASYEEVIRNCKADIETLQDIPEFGTTEYELDRSAERLICITTILRNFSFFEFNHGLLSSPLVIKFLSNTIRLLGTRHNLLRSNANLLDFMKDIITFFSNTTDKIELPSREEASNILRFLLAFAPTPAPLFTTVTSDHSISSGGPVGGSAEKVFGPVRFTPYIPSLHRYLPPAVDSLAKLLARDEPNRHHYRIIFSTDSPPSNLLTQAFGLAISVVPERIRSNTGAAELRIAEARKPYLTQGMLAADILASMCPGPDSCVARAWLEAEDGWAPSLLKLAVFLCSDRGQQQAPRPGMPPHARQEIPDAGGFGLVTHRALAMLTRLGEKSRGNSLGNALATKLPQYDHSSHDGVNGDAEEGDGDGEGEKAKGKVVQPGGDEYWLSPEVVPRKETVLGALLANAASVDAGALKRLVAFAALEGPLGLGW